MSLRRKALLSGCLLAAAVRLAIGISQQSAKEAPAGPSFNGAQSISNGITEPPGDTFALDQQIYELNHSVQTGLGPVYNATACVSCHENPNSGGAGQITELRVGHNDENGNFVNPTIFINDGMNTITGRSIVNGAGDSVDAALFQKVQNRISLREGTQRFISTLLLA
jgi:hypothetical protein